MILSASHSALARRLVVLPLVALLVSSTAYVAPAAVLASGPTTWWVAIGTSDLSGPVAGALAAGTSCSDPGFITGDYGDSASATVQAAVDAASSGDTVHICGGTWEFVESVDVATGPLAFVGDGASGTDGTFIDGANSTTGLFEGSTTETLSFASMALQDSDRMYGQGGAIGAAGAVVVTDAVFSGNQAQASTGHGGAIFATGDVTADTSVFSGNVGTAGGAIYALGAVTLVASDFSSNTALVGFGGAVFAGDTLDISSSSFSANAAAGVDDLLMSGFGGGGAVFGAGAITIASTSFTGNTTAGSAGGGVLGVSDITVSGGSFTANSALDYGGAIGAVWGGLPGSIDVSGGTFTDNSAGEDGGAIGSMSLGMLDGPVTRVPAASPGSSQRRLGPTAPRPATRATKPGALVPGYDVTVRDATFTGNGVTEDGGGAVVALSSDGAAGSGSVDVVRSTFTGNRIPYAGAVGAMGDIRSTDSVYEENIGGFDGVVDGGGGAIWANGSVLTVRDTFTANEVVGVGLGGAVGATGDITVTDGTFVDNRSTGVGGAVYAESGAIRVGGSTFAGNVATEYGGAILAAIGVVEAWNSTFVDNSSGTQGGAIYASARPGVNVITNSTFRGNTAAWTSPPSGAVYAVDTLQLANNIFGSATDECTRESLVDLGGNIDVSIIGSGCVDATVGTSVEIADPALLAFDADLADNGGPTQTLAIGAGSVAASYGVTAICAADPVDGLDQRGVERHTGEDVPFCSSGAYEWTAGPARTLSVEIDGTGSGSVTSEPAGIDCGETCSASISDGTEVTLTAHPAAGSVFTGWSDAGCPGTAPCTLVVAEDTTVTATFARRIPAPLDGPRQGITFALPPTGNAGASLTLTGTATSGLPLTYASLTPAVCTVSGTTLHLLAAGTCTVVASQEGDALWPPATPVSSSMSVTGTAVRQATAMLARIGPAAGPLDRLVLDAAPGAALTLRLATRWDIGGSLVEIWRKRGTGPWTKIAVRRVDAAGQALYAFPVTSDARYRWRYAGDPLWAGAWSNPVTVRLR